LGLPRLAAYDHNPERLAYAVSQFEAEPFSTLEAALDWQPEVVLICTPPVFHVEQAMQALRAGAHVFIEKPLSDRIEDVDALAEEVRRRGAIVQVGYNLRFHPPLQGLKEQLEKQVVGKILWARLEAGSYLPEWHPWQDYRKSYTARRELGGGIILDGSHELDYMTWFFGAPKELACLAGKVSQLEVDVEDCATVLLRFPTGLQADVHLDFVQRTYSRNCVLAGETGKLSWDFKSNALETVHADGRVERVQFEGEVNDMYVSEMREFLDCCETGKNPRFGLEEAILTLRIALAARCAAAERKWVTLG
jgi:predicted dehydrogenase